MMQWGVKSMIVAEIFPLHDAAGSQTFLLHFAAGSQISPLHYAAGSQISPLKFETKFENNLGYESGPKMDTLVKKTRAVKSRATVPFRTTVR
jgi:hypothetical protein